MIETDEVAAALKRHRLKEGVHRAKLERRKKEAGGELQFNSDSGDEEENPYDSDEREYEAAAKAD